MSQDKDKDVEKILKLTIQKMMKKRKRQKIRKPIWKRQGKTKKKR